MPVLRKILGGFEGEGYGIYLVRMGRETMRATAGPCLLTFITLHLFCYLGIYLWEGKVGEWLNGRGGEYYYLLNFNSYGEGLVTLFNLMVVNDWNQIAKVFTAVSKVRPRSRVGVARPEQPHTILTTSTPIFSGIDYVYFLYRVSADRKRSYGERCPGFFCVGVH